MLELRHKTDWVKFNREGYDNESLQQFISAKLADPGSVCYVWDTGDHGVRAFCGASLTRFHLPPHMLLVYEWGWAGESRYTVKCWQGVKAWAKKRGAELAQRASHAVTPGRHIVEHVTWEVL